MIWEFLRRVAERFKFPHNVLSLSFAESLGCSGGLNPHCEAWKIRYWVVMAFGLKDAAYIFTKLIKKKKFKKTMGYVRELGCRSLIYIDDLFSINASWKDIWDYKVKTF